MKMKTVSLLAGVAVPLILASTASAEFTGVYANFSPDDAAASVIFQHPLQAANYTAPSGAFVPLPGFNILRHDSFVTIGKNTDTGDLTDIIGLDSWTDTRLTGHTSPGVPDNPLDQVVIGQFTVADPVPNGGVFGQLFVNFRHTDAVGVLEFLTPPVSFDNQGPAPGALALLGVAGLMGGRRRRK